MDNYLPIECTAHGVRDSHGSTWGGVSVDTYDTLDVFGLKDESGIKLHFEYEAFRLAGWCKAKGLDYVCSNIVVGVTFLSK